MQRQSEFSLMIRLMLKLSILIKTKPVMWDALRVAATIIQTPMLFFSPMTFGPQ